MTHEIRWAKSTEITTADSYEQAVEIILSRNANANIPSAGCSCFPVVSIHADTFESSGSTLIAEIVKVA